MLIVTNIYRNPIIMIQDENEDNSIGFASCYSVVP